jgi:rhodanese-related sulfurtransferase
MGPLVPDILSNEFSFVVALVIGIAFGFVLEQAGFSTTKKLVGLFYGYDFTVLKVFFTGGIVAMIGVVILGHFGILDLDLIYVNPTFLRSALIGGGIMGAGFIIGGFCPGTSICAVATGKIDAFWFIIGSLIGILIFMEFYPSFEKTYFADNMGNLRMDKYLGMSQELFATLLTALAILAFFFTQKIQNKVRNDQSVYPKEKKIRYSIFAAIPFIIIIIVVLTPSFEQHIINKANMVENQKSAKEMTADKLAIDLANNYYQINLIDLRSPEKYKEYHLPLSINIPYDSLQNREWKNYFKQKYKTNIFYSDSIDIARKAYVIATNIGDAETYILHENISEFKKQNLDTHVAPVSATKEEQQLVEFRNETARRILDLENKLKNQMQPAKKEIKKVKGGCS